jgi:hypothetical protein
MNVELEEKACILMKNSLRKEHTVYLHDARILFGRAPVPHERGVAGMQSHGEHQGRPRETFPNTHADMS